MKRFLSASIFEPFRETLFTTLWIGAFISNVGTWMQNVGVGWFAATMSASPLMISLIQAASSLPALLFSYPAGVISDHADRRKLLICIQAFLFVVVLILSVLTQLNLLDIDLLILFSFFIGIGAAFTTPVWQAITPEVVSKNRMKEAVALNGVNFNLARAVGPALGGIILVYGGIKSIFLFNAVSFLALMVGLYRWNNTLSSFQPVHFLKTARDGIRAVSRSRPFIHLLIRTISFTAFVSIVFAFLPQLSTYEWKQNSVQYTWLWANLGIGALAGSYLYGMINKSMSAAKIIFFSCELVAICLFLLTGTTNFYILNTIMFVTGIGWIIATSTLNVLAQQHAPDAFRGRFLAVNVTVFQGSIALSSIGWGYLAELYSIFMVIKIAAILMGIFAAALLLLPMEETELIKKGSVACSDPLLQYHVK
jgi:MFS family permease